MIKQDRGETTSSGDSNIKLSELALLTVVMIETLSEETGVPYDDIASDLEKSVRVNKLTRAGMPIEDAIEVVGLEVKAVVEENIKRETRNVEIKTKG